MILVTNLFITIVVTNVVIKLVTNLVKCIGCHPIKWQMWWFTQCVPQIQYQIDNETLAEREQLTTVIAKASFSMVSCFWFMLWWWHILESMISDCKNICLKKMWNNLKMLEPKMIFWINDLLSKQLSTFEDVVIILSSLVFPPIQPFLIRQYLAASEGFVKFYLASFPFDKGFARLLLPILRRFFHLNQVSMAIIYLCQWFSLKIIRHLQLRYCTHFEESKEKEEWRKKQKGLHIASHFNCLPVLQLS